ncbi:hypothetical protein FB451DRAFT_1166348 [Mycena latifolia]|nr:hypothetical protein FB451DRAFT_1166348 [Mycena latifolia]
MDSLFLEHLLAPRSPSKVTRLRELTLVGVDNDEYLVDLIERTRRTLRHLNLQYSSSDPTDWTHVFENCTHRLEKITVESTLENLKIVSDLDWTALDTVLTRPEFANVREVVFQARLMFQWFATVQEADHSLSQIAANARMHLSAADAKGILSFDLKLGQCKSFLTIELNQVRNSYYEYDEKPLPYISRQHNR